MRWSNCQARPVSLPSWIVSRGFVVGGVLMGSGSVAMEVPGLVGVRVSVFVDVVVGVSWVPLLCRHVW